jgi:hypothetical protein
MNGFRGSWKKTIALCLFFLLISGCVTQAPPKNNTSMLSDIFSAPIGGFVHPEKYTIQDPNTTFESDYMFYSRDWSGEVKYSVFGKYKGQILNDSSTLYVEPSTFIAEPKHAYTAKVYMNASNLPKEFFVPQPIWQDANRNTISYSPYILYLNVSMAGTDSLFSNDFILLQSFYNKPNSPVDEIAITNGAVSLKKGETKNFTITYSPDWYTSLYEISYSISKTPLNVTVEPSRFIARHDLRYPVNVNITADPRIDTGQYPVSFTQQGGVNEVIIRCDNCVAKDPRKQTFVVNVTVE